MDLELNENELKLIEAIKAGDVDEAMKYIIENICGGGMALILAECGSAGLLKIMPPEIQVTADIVMKFGFIAVKYKEKEKADVHK